MVRASTHVWPFQFAACPMLHCSVCTYRLHNVVCISYVLCCPAGGGASHHHWPRDRRDHSTFPIRAVLVFSSRRVWRQDDAQGVCVCACTCSVYNGCGVAWVWWVAVWWWCDDGVVWCSGGNMNEWWYVVIGMRWHDVVCMRWVVLTWSEVKGKEREDSFEHCGAMKLTWYIHATVAQVVMGALKGVEFNMNIAFGACDNSLLQEQRRGAASVRSRVCGSCSSRKKWSVV